MSGKKKGDKPAVDKTFGMKNKKGAKGQAFVASVQASKAAGDKQRAMQGKTPEQIEADKLRKCVSLLLLSFAAAALAFRCTLGPRGGTPLVAHHHHHHHHHHHQHHPAPPPPPRHTPALQA